MVSRAAVWSAAEVEIPCREHYLVLCAARLRIRPAAADREVGTSANIHIYPWMNLKPRAR